MQSISYQRLDLFELFKIKPLWEELNNIHLIDSIYFKEHYSQFSFEKRSASWTNLSEENILLLVAKTNNKIIAYCVSTIESNQKGEIDSLFVNDEFRGKGVGKTLVEKSMKWLQSKQCKPIRLAVSYGHEEVLVFIKN